MATIDKAAIAWTIAIVAVAAGIAGMGDNLQSSAPAETYTPPPMEEAPAMETMEEGVMKAAMPGWDRFESMQDPGIVHESHQLAVILPPSENTYKGTIMFDASEDVQLVSLKGPLGPNDFAGKIWTPDGDTKFELTLVEFGSSGEWSFEGNAVAVHTFNTNQFIVDVKLDYAEMPPAETMEEPEPEVMEEPEPEPAAGPQTVVVTVPAGTSVPGCEETNECYLPPSVSVNVGDTVSWDNVDTAAHTVTSGTPADGPDGMFDSSLLMGGATFEVTFDTAGSYDYFCMVHPWMIGDVQVS